MPHPEPEQEKAKGQQYSRQMLMDMYEQSARADEKIFQEMRGTIRLYANQHKNGRDRGEVTEILRQRGARAPGGTNRIDVVLNQIPRIADIYVNEIMAATPSVIVKAKDGGDAKSNRLARLNQRVLEEDKKRRPDYEMRVEEEAETFTIIGEVACKLYWDDATDWLMEEPINSCDLLRAPGSRRIEDSPWLIHRSLYTEEELAEMLGKDKASKLTYEGGGMVSSEEGTNHIVFNSQSREYQELKALEVMEFYLRPNADYPEGLFKFFTRQGVLRSGRLPGGVFPIVVGRCMTTPTLARGHSFIRTIFPLQMEINRSAGQDASNMVVFGDDKLVTNANSTVQLDKEFSGITHLKLSSFTDVKSSILHIPGQAVPKYVDYINQNIKLIDFMSNVLSTMEKRQDGKSGDISYVLYSRIKDKSKFSKIARRFETYLKVKAETKLRLFRHYLNEQDLLHDGNREDALIVPDFKETSNEDYVFDVQVANDTAESMLGTSMRIQNILQYVGGQLSRDEIGLLLRSFESGNLEAITSSFSVNYDAFEQNVIMLEKGIMPTVTPTEDFKYKAERLSLRMNRPDFQLLDVFVQQKFHQFLQQCEQMLAQQNNEKMRLEQGLIPTTGHRVAVDMYVEVPTATGGQKTVKAKIPYDALRWLVNAMEKQGMTTEGMNQLPEGVQNNVLRNTQGAPAQLGAPSGQGQQVGQGQAGPGGPLG